LIFSRENKPAKIAGFLLFIAYLMQYEHSQRPDKKHAENDVL